VTAPAVSTEHERAAFVPVGDDAVLAVLTRPPGAPRGVAVVILPGGWTGTGTGRNRLLVRMGRQLAADGFHAVRFDYRGVGDSTGADVVRWSLEELFVDDLEAVLQWTYREAAERCITGGVCFGARTALAAAARDPRVHGLVLISVPARVDIDTGLGHLANRFTTLEMARRGLRPSALRNLLHHDVRRTYLRAGKAKVRALAARRLEPDGNGSGLDPNLVPELEAVLARGAPVLMMFGTEDAEYQVFQHQRRGRLGEVLEQAGDLVEVRVLPGQLHAFSRLEVQETVLEALRDWVLRHGGVPG
jgi:pimeloyl-ACP methyl ester carboxylesterase